MADWIHQTLLQLKVFVKRKARELETMKVWEQIKDQFSDMFEKNKELEKEIKGINQQIDNFDKVDKEFTEVIQSKNELIHDIETYHEQKAKLFEEVKKLEPKAYKGYSRDEYIKEIQGLTYEQRIEKARDMIEQQRQKLERIREYEFER